MGVLPGLDPAVAERQNETWQELEYCVNQTENFAEGLMEHGIC